MREATNRKYYRNARYFWRIISIAALLLSFLSFPCLRFLGHSPFFRGFGLVLFYSACYVAVAGLASLCLFRIPVAEIDDLRRSLTLYRGIVGFRKHLRLGLDKIEYVTVTRRFGELTIPFRGFYWGPVQCREKAVLFRLKSKMAPSESKKVVQMERHPFYEIASGRDGLELWLLNFPKARYGLLLSDLKNYGLAVDQTSIPVARSPMFRVSLLLFDFVLLAVLVFWGHFFLTSV